MEGGEDEMKGTRGNLVKLALVILTAGVFVAVQELPALAATTDVTVGPSNTRTYSPQSPHINKGDTVHWIWATGTHTVTSNDNGATFDSGAPQSGGTFDHVFNDVGLFKYHCLVHGLGMSGEIIVGKLLSVSKSGNGVGHVTSDTGGINCPGTCQAAYDSSTTVSGAVSGTGTTVMIPMSSDTNETATFKLKYRPDGLIKLASASSFHGNNVYNTSGAGQTVSASVLPGHSRSFLVQEQNDGTLSDSFKLKGPGSSPRVVVHYFAGTMNITSAVVAGSYSTGSISPGASKTYKIVLKARSSAPKSTFGDLLTATSTGGGEKDAVLARHAIT